MANTAHLFRRQSSRDLNFHGSHRDYTKTLDELELKVARHFPCMHEILYPFSENLKGFSNKIIHTISPFNSDWRQSWCEPKVSIDVMVHSMAQQIRHLTRTMSSPVDISDSHPNFWKSSKSQRHSIRLYRFRRRLLLNNSRQFHQRVRIS